MSGICGWVGSPPREEARKTLESMAAPLHKFDGSRQHHALAADCAVSAAGLGSQAAVVQSNGMTGALCGQVSFADAELNARAQRDGALAVMLELYRLRGADALQQLGGSFAFALIDQAAGAALLAVDRMGVHSLSYTLADGVLLFGSRADSINAHPAARPQINRQSLYNYFYFHMVPGPETIFSGQKRIEPGGYLSMRAGKLSSGRYWEMRFVENEARAFPDLKRAFIGTLEDSVRDLARSQSTGAFLSGGTDSSTLAGLLGRVTGAPAKTYSIGFEAQGFDEMSYARIAAQHFQTEHHEYYVTPDDIVDAVPRLAAIYDQPFGNSSAVPTYYCARMAQADGITRLLGGDGGDELFGGNERYAKQYVFSLYGRLPGALRKALIEPAAFGLPMGERITPVRKLKSYIQQASVPMPARLETYNLLERSGPQRMFTPDFFAAVDSTAPAALLHACYHSAHARSLINRMLALDLQFTLADNDLPKVTRSCELAGVDVQFPMLDDKLVAFSARLAPGLKLRGTRLRYFFKEALRGFLPDAIITKQKHGFGLPFGPWLQTHKPLQDLVGDSLASFKRRNIVEPAFLTELTHVRVAEHPGYYGTLVWVLMMLEQWLQHHRIAP